MPRYTTAYCDFVDRLDEVHTLRKFAAAKEKQDPIGLASHTNALCRGAIVLLCAHLEAYIKELGELALDSMHSKNVSRANVSPRLFYHISKDLLNELRNTADPNKIAEKVFSFIQRDAAYWSHDGIFPDPLDAERFNKGFSNPGFQKIKKYLNRFGYESYHDDLNTRLQANSASTVNMVDHLVEVRNKIAHGDSSIAKTPIEVGEMVSITQIFCRTTDDLFATWWRTNFCTIR